MESTLTTKGQITLPKALRDALHLKTGDKVIFEPLESGGYVLKSRTLDVRTLKGFGSYKGAKKSITDMQDAITQNAAK
ncbi:MAG: AbrB/MazE/SpoVT family DNA-binding domain-containing protein [Robiginitomaculum sp.]|nr:AbrB/MazE/SpoVT family DNA-binding domain-containing protein [Robiginitomaculum sp.]